MTIEFDNQNDVIADTLLYIKKLATESVRRSVHAHRNKVSPLDVIRTLTEPDHLSLVGSQSSESYLQDLSALLSESFVDHSNIINRHKEKPKSFIKVHNTDEKPMLPFMPPLPPRHLYHITTNDERIVLDGILDSYKVSSGSDMATLVAADLPISMGNIHDSRPIAAIPCQSLTLNHTAEPVRRKFPVYPSEFVLRPMKKITNPQKIAAYPIYVSKFAPLLRPTQLYYLKPSVLESALVRQQSSILRARLEERRLRWKECGFKAFNTANSKSATKVSTWSDAFKSHVQVDFLYKIVNHANNESSNEDCELKKYEPKSDKRKKHIPGDVEVQVESEMNNGAVEALRRYIDDVITQDSTKKAKSQQKALKYQHQDRDEE